jgi:phospho-N-acetylmuramoyl-pentapeptide-transferase
MMYLFGYMVDIFAGSAYVANSLLARCFGCMITSFIVAWLLSPQVIKILSSKQMSQTIRERGPQQHLAKKGTPTMGGIIIIATILLNIILWADLSNRFVIIFLVASLGYGAIGFYDDYLKIKHKSSAGISAMKKLCLQIVVAVVVTYSLYASATTAAETSVFAPFLVKYSYNLGWLYIFFASFVIVGTSNAVNLTDGLDGLVAWQVIVISIGLGAIIYGFYSGGLSIGLPNNYLYELGEAVILCGSLLGTSLAFLWYNSYPAEVFMGDVGSLSFGAMLGLIAVISHLEFLFMLMGLIFVLETISVILQVLSFKIRSTRIFKMAPLHHHFELSGWPETKVVARFSIVTILLVFISVITTILI